MEQKSKSKKVVKAKVAPKATKAKTTKTTKAVKAVPKSVKANPTPKVAKAKVAPKPKKYAGFKVTHSNERFADEGKEVLVKVRNLDVSFGHGIHEFKAVKDFSLNIYQNEVLGLVGESGSGKTTTGSAIAGLVKRSKGLIKMEDTVIPAVPKDIKGDINKYMVKNIQMIFQDPADSLNPHKTIRKVVLEGLNNLDDDSVYDLFIQSFDGETVSKIYDMAHGKSGQPASLKRLTFENLSKRIAKREYKKIYQNLYIKVREDLAEMNADWANELSTYLEVRLYDRQKFYDGKVNLKKIKKKMLIDVLKSVGLSERILGRYPLEFSGGQQQRLGISRAIILNPKLLIADEPISALDVSIQAQVINILNDLKKKLGLTILLIAHDLRMVEYISDRIAVMYKGTLVELGPANEIANNPIHPYTKMLLDAVPSIDSKKESLVGFTYDPEMHDYEHEKPEWIKVNNTERFVLATPSEAAKWLKKDWSSPVKAEPIKVEEVTDEQK